MLVRHVVAVPAFVAILFAGSAAGQKISVGEILEAHRASVIGNSAGEPVRNVILVGDATVRFITGKTPEAKGRIVVASEGAKSFMGMRFSAPDYPQETFTCNGKDVKVGATVNNSRSVLGNFLATNEKIVRESLFAGVLFRSWGVLGERASKAKISLDGTKTIAGREAYVLNYTVKGATDLSIRLYFDKETFRHIRSEYSMIFSASIGRTPNESARFSETRLKVTEEFGDFRTEGGLTLPRNHKINYLATGQNGTTEIEWQFNYTEIGFNQQLAPDTFGG